MNPFDPMPTIKSILGMTMAQDIEQSIMLAQLDDFEAPQCESKRHNMDPAHHSGAAAFLLCLPCQHGGGFICIPYSVKLLVGPPLQCLTCSQKFEPSELTFLPIGGQK